MSTLAPPSGLVSVSAESYSTGTASTTPSPPPLSLAITQINHGTDSHSHSSPAEQQQQHTPTQAPQKTYSFIPLQGNAVRKRPRRRYDEIERLYSCSWHGCNKSYGTLNHLNAHVTMQRHGDKRSPNEFKDMRKQWRKQKKDEQDR
ncbi:hypothetical protein BKA62DRAFT_618745, partial [Auriculariales sp. MPI-PUGE-AT-0066]